MKQCIYFVLLTWSSLALSTNVVDPTKPKNLYIVVDEQVVLEEVAESGQETIRLQGVLNRKGYRVAFIAGELYSKGDEVQGYRIGEIHKDHVVLLSSGTQKRLYVYE